ncbi:hypothetical protein [Bradyrhizobium macuxiense]|uniref:hypothetical protein n=1 Tax=Bradyrhizobium macuxiense TaxID=1755647 RepID=UPI000A655B65|nr:hypothetical protein [Bradyrhizobium macuxiense]
MPLRSAGNPHRLAPTGPRFTPHSPCTPIEPIFRALLRSVVFFAALAMPFVIALYMA